MKKTPSIFFHNKLLNIFVIIHYFGKETAALGWAGGESAAVKNLFQFQKI